MSEVKNSVAVKELRDRTGMGFGLCQAAWTESGNDMAKALDILKEKGATRAEKLSDRSTEAGYVGMYRHHDGKGVMCVTFKCETDFVANLPAFRELANMCATQWFASTSKSREEMLGEELFVFLSFFQQSGTISEAITALSAQTGEKIFVENTIRISI